MGSGKTERRRRNKQRYISKQQTQIQALQKERSDKKSTQLSATAAVKVCDNPSQNKRQHIEPTHSDESKTSMAMTTKASL